MRTVFAALAASLFFAGLAFADTLTVSCSQSSAWEIGPTTFFHNFPCPLFDKPGDTLNGVQVKLTLTANATFSLYNFSDVALPGFPPQPVTQTGETLLPLSVTFGTPGLIVDSFDLAPLDSGLQTIGPGAVLLVPATSTASGTSFNTPSLLDLFKPGNVLGETTLQINVTVSPGIQTFFGFSASSLTYESTIFNPDAFQATAMVTYDYTSPASEVPEPRTLLTLEAGLMGMAAAVAKLRSR